MPVTQKPQESRSKKGLPGLSKTERDTVDLLRKRGSLSRTALAKLLNTSRASMTAIVGNLLEMNVLSEVGHGKSDGGRRPRLLDINPGLGYIAGVDMGATSVDVALADFSGKLLERRSQVADVRSEPEDLLGTINDIICEMLNTRSADGDDLVGLGMGVPGPVEYPAGLLIRPPLMPAWERFPIKEFIRDRFPMARPMVDNDVNIMAIGEANVGGGAGLDNFFYIKIGTGIGCGIVVNGEIYRGSDGCAGDIGHICIDYNGPICHCGNAGCLEFMAAGPAIAKKGRLAAESGESELLKKRLIDNQGQLTSKDVGEVAAAGDRAANRIINESGRMIGGVLAGLVNFYNPEAIFIGGGVSDIGHQFLSTIRQATLRRATALSTRSLIIDYSELGPEAGIHGAIWLAIDSAFALAK